MVLEGVHGSGLWMAGLKNRKGSGMGLGTVMVAGSAQSSLWVQAALKFSPEKTSVVKQDIPWRLRASLGLGTLEKGWSWSSESLWGSW